MPVGRDTSAFCSQHMECVQTITRSEAQVEELQKEKVRDAEKIRDLEHKVAHLSGFYEGAVPKLQADVSRMFQLSDERNEQAQVYNGQVRALAQKVQDVNNDVTFGLDRKADKQLTENKLRNLQRWVYVGFVGWGLAILVFGLIVLLGKVGVKTP